MIKFICRALAAVFAGGLLMASSASAQGTAFTYQGWLMDNGGPAAGNYDLMFTIFDAPSNLSSGAAQTAPSI